MHIPVPYSAKIPERAILSFLLATAILVPITIWNRYVFLETNLPLLLILLISAPFIYGFDRVPRDIVFPGISMSFFLFIVYAWFRLDSRLDFNLSSVDPSGIRPGLAYILDLIMFYFLFVISAVLFYNRPRLSLFLWLLICGYVIAYIVRNSFDITGLQSGFNLSSGIVILTLLPFVFLMHTDRNRMPLIPSVLLFFCILWVALIGARTAVASLLLFYIAIRAWPIITRSRFIYFATFWSMILSIAGVTVLYVLYGINNPADPLLAESLVESSNVGILQKSIGTRVEIWIHLAFLISQQPIFGYGTDHGTEVVNPVWSIVFTFNRDNLSAHSLYFELLYRLGAVGLLGFILIMFSIWRVFWSGREQWAVQVAGASLLALLFYSTTGGFMVFNDLQLRSGFVWIILGIGAGACLRGRKDARIRSPARS